MRKPLRPLLLASLLVACTNPGSDESGTDTLLTAEDESSAGDEIETGPSDAESGEGCQSDDDCEPSSPVCDTQSGQCFPACVPGTSQTCYDGPEGTAQVGICEIGSHVCEPDGTWPTSCPGEVLPTLEDCENGLDDDCDGNVDAADKDGDGFFSCVEGELADCCDEEITECVGAAFVNPGAFEVAGNEVDDDCDGMTDEATPSCDQGLISSSSDPLAYARALDLCATTSEDAPTWGVISGSFARADGTGSPVASQRSIRPQFGDANLPFTGNSMVVLSSGTAAAPGQNSPNHGAFEPGTEFNNSVPIPIPIPTCPNVGTGDGMARDSIQLSLDIRVPTNARSFTAKFAFFSAEYPEWVCSQYNDAFVAILTSEADNDVPNGNIAVFDANDGNPPWPISINMAKLTADSDIPLFTTCQSGTVGCQANMPFSMDKCTDTEGLVGTGFDAIDTTQSCNGDGFPVGGGTGWLGMAGNVEPGEVITIDFAIWDAGGYRFDSLVLLDDWQWSLDAASPGVQLP